MNISVKALVLNVISVGDADRLCVLLTENLGIIRAFAKGAQRMRNKNFPATMQFVYGSFQIFEHKDKFYIDESDSEEMYLPLRDDIQKLALAQYLCELAMELAPPDIGCGVFLRLLRYAFHYLTAGQRPPELVKAAAEIRALGVAGYQPDLTMCQGCGCFEPESCFLMLRSGYLRCSECGLGNTGEPAAVLNKGALTAMRHAAYAELKSIFSFELGGESMKQFAGASERYLLENVEHSFVTLDFYRSLL